MDIRPTSNRLYGFMILFDMHTTFYPRALKGISDDDAHQRLDTVANHMAWIAGSILHERYELAAMLGLKEQHEGYALFEDHKGIQGDLRYPAVATYIKDWDHISPLLRDALLKATDEQLDARFEMMPGYETSVFEYISFQIYREATCIGQLALWRRLLGYEALRYDE